MNLSLKLLFVTALVSASLQANASTYNDCVEDAKMIISLAKTEGVTKAKEYEQKASNEDCFVELGNIEAKYGDKVKGRNPHSVMKGEDRAKWAKLFDAIDAKNFKGVPFLIASYYYGSSSK